LEALEWINPTQDTEKWQAVAKKETKLRVP